MYMVRYVTDQTHMAIDCFIRMFCKLGSFSLSQSKSKIVQTHLMPLVSFYAH